MESVPKIYHTSLPNLHTLRMDQTKVIVEMDLDLPFVRGIIKGFHPHFLVILILI